MSGLVVGVGLAVAPAGPADVVAAPQIELAQPPGFAPAPVDGTRTGQAGGPAAASNLTVSVEPGTLAVFDPRSEIAVARVAGSDRYTGVISGLRIADVRGSGAGWRLTVIVTSVHTSDGSVTARTVNAHVRRLVGFAESASGLLAEAGTAVAGGHRALIATADPRHGMGAFDVTATIAVRLRDASFSRGWAQLRFGLV